jgi:glycine/D-amino acid oxidase-like deaminating enzyme
MAASGRISLWMDQLDGEGATRRSLEGDMDVDVAIIGAGYTGLWTAWYLKHRAPQLNIVILEAQAAGFGASGRNGGWLIGGISGENGLIGHLPEPQRRESWELLHAIPDEVARVMQIESIDCDYRKGGVLYCAARYREQAQRLKDYLRYLHQLGLTDEDYRWVSPAELSGSLRVRGATGALYSPHCATIQPAKLARGLAFAVERSGVRIFENTRVNRWGSRLLETGKGRVKANWIVPAMEGYARDLPPLGRYQLPVQSLLVATEPLSDAVWQELGLADGQAFSEFSRQVTYGQRTADNRLVFGARGAYLFGGKLRHDFGLTKAEVRTRRDLMVDLFPVLRDVNITHTWGGNLGMARRFHPHMLIDRRNGIALAGGYGGEGVGASNLAGRTLADLILERSTIETRQNWVLHDRPFPTALRTWEREPWRWLGYAAISRSFACEDKVLANPHSPPWHRAMAQSLAAASEHLTHWKAG